jgi:ribosomal protein S18 acetylase RimI-like enzyme
VSGTPAGVELRRLRPGDEVLAARAVALLGISAPSDLGAALRRDEATVLVALDGDAVVGCAYGHELVHPDGECTMLLYSLDVAADARRRGIGRALSTAFVDDARARGCTEAWVLTELDNDAAIATYRSAGARREPDDTVLYAWRLADGNHAAG